MKRSTILAAVAVGLLAAFLLKEPCTQNAWEDHFQYRNYCYSDIFPLYFGRGLAEGQIPYVEAFNEYPVLTGMFSYAVASATDGVESYMHLTFALLLVGAAWTAWALWRLAGDVAVLWWSISPPLIIHGLTNWDLLAVALAAGGWWSWRAGKRFWSAFLFGLGGAAKLYPAFFLPFLFFDALRADFGGRWPSRVHQLRGAGATLAGGTLGFAGPNVAVAAAGREGWLESWRFHSERSTDFETLWEVFVRPALEPVFPAWDWQHAWHGFVGAFGMAALLVATAALALLVWRGKDPLLAGSMLILVFLLTNRVYSPQYTLWVLPLLLLLHVRTRPLVLFLAADLVVFLVRYQMFTPAPGHTNWDLSWLQVHRYAVAVRWFALAWITVQLALQHGLIRRFGRGGQVTGDPVLERAATTPDA